MKESNYEKQEITQLSDLSENIIRNKKGELYKFIVQDIEKPLIEKILERTFGNQCKAAKLLGINRNTLHTKIKKLNIDLEKYKHI